MIHLVIQDFLSQGAAVLQVFYTVKEALLRERTRVSCKCLQWNAGRSSYVFAGSLLVSLE